MLEAKSMAFNFLSSVKFIEVPFFQRPYVWKEENWDMLLDDLSSAYESKIPHFLGSLILKQQDDNVKLVIDGQQRLTTFSILVKALYDNIDDADRQEFFNIIYTRISEDGIRVNKSKLRHSKADANDFEKVMKVQSVKEITEIPKSSKILNCYKFFSEEIAKKDWYNLEFLDFIVNTNLFVVINIDEKDDEQQIFDSINSKGMALSAADIIKNDLFANLLKKYENREEAEEIYYTNWRDVFEPVREDEEENNDFWDIDNKNNFFYCFALLQEFFTEKDRRAGLAKVYKNHIKSLNQDKLNNIVKDIKIYAENYQNLIWFNNKDKLDFNNYEARLMQIIAISKLETLLPIVLKIKINKLDEKCFLALEKFIIRVWISGATTKSLYNFVVKHTKEIIDYNSLIKVLNDDSFAVKDEELKAVLKKTGTKKLTNAKATLILFWIELYRTKQSFKYEYSLEHIMPQEWQKNWHLDNIEKADELVYQLGNLTLITKNLNSAISNKAWKEKKAELVKYTSLDISNDVRNANSWGENEITARTEKLIKDFFTIWGI